MLNYDIITLGCSDATKYAKIAEISNEIIGQRSKFFTSQLMITVLWQTGVTKPEKYTYAISPKESNTKLRVEMIDAIPSTTYPATDLAWVYNTVSQRYEIYIKGRAAYDQPARITITCEEQTAIFLNPKPLFETLITPYTINYALAPNLFTIPMVPVDTFSNIAKTVTGSVYLSATTHTLTVEGYEGTRVHRIQLELIARGSGLKKAAEVILYQGGIIITTSDGISAIDNKDGTVTISGLQSGYYLLYEIRR